jgi:maleylacetoacetate isomerase
VKLYTYYRSSAAYRVRIGLELKGLAREDVAVNLATGEQNAPEYRKLNPQGLIPLLVDGETRLAQSLAILEYLDERYPEPPLLPEEPAARARVRQLALLIACEVHPLNNPRVLNFLTGELGQSEAVRLRWYRHWIGVGLGALEALLQESPHSGRFCHGSTPTLADVLLVPQVYNARRFECDLSALPRIVAIDAQCRELPAFQAAAPEAQPDAP